MITFINLMLTREDADMDINEDDDQKSENMPKTKRLID